MTYYSQNYASIIGASLVITVKPNSNNNKKTITMLHILYSIVLYVERSKCTVLYYTVRSKLAAVHIGKYYIMHVSSMFMVFVFNSVIFVDARCGYGTQEQRSQR